MLLWWRGWAGRVVAGLLVGAIGAAAAWALVADGKDWSAVGAGVAAALAGAFGPTLVAAVGAGTVRLRERRAAVAGVRVPQLPPSVAWLLHPTSGVVEFFGRRQVLTELTTWCAGRDAGPVRLVVAPGGFGKTRLAYRFCGLLDGWECWWIAHEREEATAGLLDEPGGAGRVLLVVDYADARDPAGLAALLVAASQPRRRVVRVLLLARTAGPWWTSLSSYHKASAAVLDALTTSANVIALDAAADDRSAGAVVADAAAQFAGHLDRPVPVVPDRVRDRGAGLLRLHAEALLLVLGGPRSADGRFDVIGEVLGHEARYWRAAADRTRLPLPGDPEQAGVMLRRVVAVAALLGATDREQAEHVVRTALADGTENDGLVDPDRVDVARWVGWLYHLYPADGAGAVDRLGTLQPDLLAETLAVNELTTCTRDQRAAIFTGLTAGQAVQALTILGRATIHHPAAVDLIEIALQTDTPVMADAVLTVALQFPGTFAARLAALLPTANLDPQQMRDLAGRVPFPTRELNPVALALTRAALDQETPDTPDIDRAWWRTWHAIRLAEAGRRAEALTASQEAVALFRELVAGNRDGYLPALALSVNNHAVRLADAGRRAEALTAIEDAVAYYRELVEGNRDAYLPYLAGSVNNYASRLAEAGRRVEALTASEEAVALRRELVAGNRDAHLPYLAMSVNNYASRLAEAGRRVEALTASEEAVALRRELVAGNRDAHLPYLAMSVNNYASRLAEAGRRVEALTASEEAVALRRELVAGNRDAHLPYLASSVNNHAIALAGRGGGPKRCPPARKPFPCTGSWWKAAGMRTCPTWPCRSTTTRSGWRRRGGGSKRWPPARKLSPFGGSWWKATGTRTCPTWPGLCGGRVACAWRWTSRRWKRSQRREKGWACTRCWPPPSRTRSPTGCTPPPKPSRTCMR
ncbi:tetratricopeptide repeat protein [Phytohabitans rumicis]|uniref:MalT-like TPR region domain-containing protein n=1 Tax=Phytohabitans rumicis TaxID=1076125 RepID=A0A6V8LKR5_9ACTN|nr:tetratricopeptide repeat protein [Phytohabitans rumicis]GFJ95229.1 hypothetical protein Prum_088710 [Phytohabitans rumicis]